MPSGSWAKRKGVCEDAVTKVYLEKDGGRYLVACQGHATGSVEMCAAISCLVQTLDSWLEQEDAQILTRQVGPGNAILSFRGGERCRAAFDLMASGFSRLAATDGAHIHVDLCEM